VQVVVIRFSSFGDCVLLCPLLAHLKRCGVGDVTVVTKAAYADIFEHADGADHVVPFDPGRGLRGLFSIATMLRGDRVVIDAHNNPRSRLLSWRLGKAAARIEKHYRPRLGLLLFKRPAAIPTVLEQYGALAAALGLPPAPAVPGGLTVPRELAQRVDAVAPVPPNAVAMAPGSRWRPKRWAAPRFLELAQMVAGRGLHVVLVGDAADADVAHPIAEALGSRCTDATGTRPIMETAAWIARCRAFVGNDSGLMHLAEALGVPAVGIFGPTVRDFGYFPARADSRAVERTDIACRPCSRNGKRPCLRDTQVCLDIDPGVVARALTTVLSEGGC
jgi:heptosyltransferase-2